MEEKAQALAQIVDLSNRHSITIDEISKALAPLNASSDKSQHIGKVFGFIGGIFIFAGLGIFIATLWDDFNSFTRILVTLGAGFGLHVLGMLGSKNKDYRTSTTALFLIGAYLQTGGMYVFVSEVFSSRPDWQVVTLCITAIMALQQSLSFLIFRRGELLFNALLFGTVFVGNGLDLMHFDRELIAAVLGVSLLLIAYGSRHLQYKAVGAITYLSGSWMLLWGTFELVEKTPLEIMFLGLCSFLIFISTKAQSKTLLFCSTIGMLGYIGYFTGQHFVDSVGWPIALMIFGLIMFGVSGAAVRIQRKYISSPSDK